MWSMEAVFSQTYAATPRHVGSRDVDSAHSRLGPEYLRHAAADQIARRARPRDRAVALQPGDRHARSGSTSRRSSTGIPARRSRPTTTSIGSASSRTNGCAAAPCGAGCRRPTPTGRSTCSRPAARPACRSRASRSTTSASTTRCSATRCPTSTFPKGSDWLMVGPSGPRRLRLAVEHLAQHRGGICFCVDLDPRWVIKLIKARQMDQVEALQAPRHRSGADAAQGARQHPVHVHHAEAARSAGREDLAAEGRHHAASSAAAPR